jgi:hypothetical protein
LLIIQKLLWTFHRVLGGCIFKNGWIDLGHDAGTGRELLLVEVHPLILIPEMLVLYLPLQISHVLLGLELLHCLVVLKVLDLSHLRRGKLADATQVSNNLHVDV